MLHNVNRTPKSTSVEGDFYDVEMSVDEDRFDGDVSDIAVNSYVSFRYFGQLSGTGPPIDPRVSIL